MNLLTEFCSSAVGGEAHGQHLLRHELGLEVRTPLAVSLLTKLPRSCPRQ